MFSCAIDSYLIFKRPLLSTRTLTALLLHIDNCLCLILHSIRTVDMAANKCCVPNCKITRDDKMPMHCFPNPDKEEDRFRHWLYNIGGDILALDNQYIFKNRRVCHEHFETKYHTWSNKLSPNAIPTLHLKSLTLKKRPLMDTSNIPTITQQGIQFPKFVSTPSASDIGSARVLSQALPCEKQKPSQNITKKKNTTLETKLANLRKQKDSYATRLKKALKLSENATFQKCLEKFTTLGALFTVMQFREIPKKKWHEDLLKRKS